MAQNDPEDESLLQMIAENQALFAQIDSIEANNLTQPEIQQVSDEIQDYINAQKKPNTVRSTKCHLKILHDWLIVNKFELRQIEQIPPTELNLLLAEFFVKVKRSDGKDYEPTSLDAIKGSIERHLREQEYTKSIVADKEFFKMREALKARKMTLKKAGLGRKAHASEAVTREDEDRLITSGQLGNNSPSSLQFSIFYYFTKGFGLRGRQEHRQLKFGDISLKETSSGQKYLEFGERDSKTMDGSKTTDYRKVTPKIFSTEDELDVVKLYELFCEKRPADMNVPDAPFYLTCVPQNRLHDGSAWYYCSPMGANSLGKLLKNACAEAGVVGKKTNHSLRKTCVKELTKAGIQDHEIIKITGHKNVSSLMHYDQELDLEEHEHISKILCRRNVITATSTFTNPTVSIPSLNPVTVAQQSNNSPMNQLQNQNFDPVVLSEAQQHINNKNDNESLINQVQNPNFGSVNKPLSGTFNFQGTFNNCTFYLSKQND